MAHYSSYSAIRWLLLLNYTLCCSPLVYAALVNITVDNTSDRIIYSPPDPWQQQTGVANVIDGTVSVTEETTITITISLKFIGEYFRIVGNFIAHVYC